MVLTHSDVGAGNELAQRGWRMVIGNDRKRSVCWADVRDESLHGSRAGLATRLGKWKYRVGGHCCQHFDRPGWNFVAVSDISSKSSQGGSSV